MKKPAPILVAAVVLPFLAGCVRVHSQPPSEAADRPAAALRGVVLSEAAGGGRFEFERVDRVEWTDSTVALTGLLTPEGGGTANRIETRGFALPDVAGVLVRGVDVNRTSVLIAVVGVGAAAIAGLLITGENNEGRRTGTP